jgi:hypothetical protein
MTVTAPWPCCDVHASTRHPHRVPRPPSMFQRPSHPHTIPHCAFGLSAAGGKWTTYRRMAEDAVDAALETGKLSFARPCVTSQLRLLGAGGYGPTLHTHVRIHAPADRSSVIQRSVMHQCRHWHSCCVLHPGYSCSGVTRHAYMLHAAACCAHMPPLSASHLPACCSWHNSFQARCRKALLVQGVATPPQLRRRHRRLAR